jgi:hypothetical protein
MSIQMARHDYNPFLSDFPLLPAPSRLAPCWVGDQIFKFALPWAIFPGLYNFITLIYRIYLCLSCAV